MDKQEQGALSGGSKTPSQVLLSQRPLKFLNERQVALIDRILSDIGPYGEVRLIKVKGRLRFIQWLDSEDAL